ncbi:DUF421 domain-containing protein [Pyxidicoccus fallax]|uniref:DUF421 domain-containing protein n=1 Tax=Pyxidicoccus fallax TaxID=394095 RepID=A0A848LGD2_9BACT|nr:YetF domain-containing protein [Pyxidicoccus fallax]NMO16503.1 DUF421 domain-containing protein [Pyxidicoccus fallax]NPC77435.1 DUF421 domain-containing protein [Pyxidicoccus fallax]
MKPFDWPGLWTPDLHPLEVVFRATAVYLFAQLVLRMAGRKEFARSSTFDIVLLLIISVCLRKSIVGDDESLTSAFLGLSTLAAWDRLFSWMAMRSHKAALVLEGRPVELVREGRINEDNLRKSLMSREELLSRLREHGTESVRKVRLAYLEPDGKVTFLMKKEGGEGSSLQ